MISSTRSERYHRRRADASFFRRPGGRPASRIESTCFPRGRLSNLKSLPNLHPVLVHFPIAWFPTALFFDLACVTMRRPVWMDRVAVSLYGAAALGAGVAIWAGKDAASQLGPVSVDVERLLGEHSDWAFLTLLVAIGIVLLRFDVAWRDRKEPLLRLTRVRFLALVLALVGQWVLAETADRGARLVYQHGVAVAR